jgi:hypothetical protein
LGETRTGGSRMAPQHRRTFNTAGPSPPLSGLTPLGPLSPLPGLRLLGGPCSPGLTPRATACRPLRGRACDAASNFSMPRPGSRRLPVPGYPPMGLGSPEERLEPARHPERNFEARAERHQARLLQDARPPAHQQSDLWPVRRIPPPDAEKEGGQASPGPLTRPQRACSRTPPHPRRLSHRPDTSARRPRQSLRP